MYSEQREESQQIKVSLVCIAKLGLQEKEGPVGQNRMGKTPPARGFQGALDSTVDG